ncbi:MAG: PAS domain-containing protein [Anaerolineaceae bacterium]|nr:PAS domain-containing protein [Anaerolineaceae bacterium]MCB9100744.1 PAS domain-containing protein [Anaerolineales bacterium]
MTHRQKIHQLERRLADYADVSEAAVTPKIDILNDLAWALCDTDMQRAQSLSETAYALSSEANGNGTEPYRLGMAYSLRTQGYLNQRFGDYSLGLTQLFKAQELCETLKLDDALTDVYDSIAGIHYQISNFPESLNYIYKQLEAAQRVGDSRLIANAYNNLANIYFETGDYDRAIETLHHNLKLAAETDFKRIESLSYLNLAETYLRAGAPHKALDNALRGLQVSQAAGFELFEGYAFDFVGRAYLELGEPPQAIPYLERALALSRKVESHVAESLILLSIGQAYRDMQQLEQALNYAQQGVAVAQAINANSELFKGHLLLSELYEQQGNLAQALHHFKQHHTFKELVFGEKADQRLKVLQIAYDTATAKKEAEIHRLHNVELEREIAERRRREKQLRLLESVVANTNDAILIVTADSDGGQPTDIIYANGALTELTGYHQQELIGQSPRIFQGPKTDAETIQQVREAIKRNQRIRREVLNYTKAGDERWVELDLIPVKDESEQISHWVAVRRDITQRKQFEQALQLGQERYHLATQAAAVGVWDWNLQTGEFYLDPVIKTILGYTDDEIPNDLDIWAEYVHPDDRQAVMAAAQAHIEGQTPVYAHEHRMLHKDGSVRWVYVHGKIINDEQGRPIRMIGTDADITGRKAVEAQVQRQLDYARALAAFEQTLLAPAESEADRRRLLSEALQHLLKPIEVSKLFIYENVDDSERGFCARFVADACAPGIASLIDRPDPDSLVIPWSAVPAENRRRLAEGRPVGGPVNDLFADTPAFRDYLLKQAHILSIQFSPIHFGDCWWGYVGFDDRANKRTWQEDEILLLGTVAEMLSSTLQRWQAEAKLHALNDQLEQQVKIRTTELSDAVGLLQQEIVERERAEAEIQQMVETLEQRVAARTEELATFFDLTVLAGQATHLNDVFEQALPRIVELTRSRAISVHLFEPDHTGLQLAAQQNLSAASRLRLQSVDLPAHFQHWLQQPNDPLMTTTLAQLALLPSNFHLPQCQTYLGAQIRSGNRVAGLLSCYRYTDRGFGLDEIALVTAIAEQMGMMLETQRLRQKAEEMAVLQERQRLARDLHDSVTQSLYSLSLFSRAGREAAEDGDFDRLNHSLSELEHNTLHALREMRLLLYELRPADLEQEGLIQAVKLRLNTVERRVGLRLDVRLDELPEMSPRCEVELYHIIVEAMNNVVKHAAAASLTLHLTPADRQLHLQIIDDGQGFDPSQSRGGLGLNNIRERVARLNGQLTIESAPGRGTRLEAVIPYPFEEK